MKTHAMAGTAATLALAAWLSPLGLSAQEEQAEEVPAQEGAAQESECQLQPTEASSLAATAIEKAQNAEEPAQVEQSWREALAAVQEPIESGTQDPAPYILAAQAHIGLGQYEEADALLNRFDALAPECAEAARNTRYNAWVALYNEGIQAYQAGDTETALESFETANMIYDDARSYNNAAILYQQQGDTERAKELYRAAIEAGGDEQQVANAVGNLAELLRADGSDAEAMAVYQDHLVDNPGDVDVRLHYALALTDAGEVDSAATLIDAVLDAPELNADQANRAGVVLFNAEDYGRAVRAFRKAREANPYGKEGMENLASALVQADSASEALALGDTLVQWFPYEPSNYQILANAQAKAGESRQAMATLQAGDGTPVTFESLQMARAGEGSYVVQGTAAGSESAAGTTITIPFEFLGPDGSVVATEELSFTVPGPEETQTVRLQVQAGGEVVGFRYQRAGGEGID